jgi:hypothetical protein
MLADFDRAGRRAFDRLNQLASPHFEEKEALSARQMRMDSAVEICAGRAV